MAFYDLNKIERQNLVEHIGHMLLTDFENSTLTHTLKFAKDEDTYIRKSAYLAIGKIYLAHPSLHQQIINSLQILQSNTDFKVRQTAINAAGEIGKHSFETVQHFFDKGLFDSHHSPRNAVIGSIKKMGEVNPKPILAWAEKYLHHPDKEIRREICHGIELRGRKYPLDILPLLQTLEQDQTARVRNTLVHVLGQIAYKKGCLAIVINQLKTWENKQLVADAIEEIIDVHHRYKDFADMTQEQAKQYIQENF